MSTLRWTIILAGGTIVAVVGLWTARTRVRSQSISRWA
jgi:hypothetical protein